MKKWILTTESTFQHKYVIEADTEEEATKVFFQLLETATGLCDAEIKQEHLQEVLTDLTESDLETILENTDDYLKDQVRDYFS